MNTLFPGDLLNKTRLDKKALKRNHADLHEAYQTLYGACLRDGVGSDDEDDKPVIAAYSVEEAFVQGEL